MNDDLVYDLADEMARDPHSLAFVRLADLLRRSGRSHEARHVAFAGLERHPYLADGHDVLARIMVDGGDEVSARDEWEMALRLEPTHAGALKGLGLLAYHRGDLPTAHRLLTQAAELDPSDQGLVTAAEQVRAQLGTALPPARRATPAPPPRDPVAARAPGSAPQDRPGGVHDPRTLFASLLGDGDRTALLLDSDGLVLAGTYVDASGVEVAEEIGAQLAGLADEAGRALTYLGLGAWESLLVETQHATVAMGPSREGSIVLVAAARDSQVGFVRRLLARASRQAASWLESAA
ncbi:MAG TPA: roadblock/LC7 domain-containing protein [Gemmatimonadaceae bacterium]